MSHTAIQVGILPAGRDSTFHGKLAHKATNTYEFQVTSPMIVNATLSGLTSKAELLLLDSNKAQLASSSNGKGNDSFRDTFSPGTYFAEVVGMTKRKIKYQLEISATAPPISPPAATPTSTTTASSHSGGNPGGGNNGGGTTGGGNNGGGSSSGITVQQFANALSSAISKAVNNFATDATLVEVLAPTAYYSYLKPELLQVDEDSLNGENFQAFADIQTLGQTLFDEAVYTVYWGLPSTTALLGYSQVFSDLETVVALKEISFAFLDYLAIRLPTPSTGSTPAVWTTGLLGNGSSSGLLDQSSQSMVTGYSSTDLSHINSSLNGLEGNISANDLWYQEAQQFDPYQSITEDEYDASYDPAIDPELTAIENDDSG